MPAPRRKKLMDTMDLDVVGPHDEPEADGQADAQNEIHAEVQAGVEVEALSPKAGVSSDEARPSASETVQASQPHPQRSGPGTTSAGDDDDWQDISLENFEPSNPTAFRNTSTDTAMVARVSEILTQSPHQFNDDEISNASGRIVALACMGRYARQFGIDDRDGVRLADGLEMPQRGHLPRELNDHDLALFGGNEAAARDFVFGSWLADSLRNKDGHQIYENLMTQVSPVAERFYGDEYSWLKGRKTASPEGVAASEEAATDTLADVTDGRVLEEGLGAHRPAMPEREYVSDSHAVFMRALDEARANGLAECQDVIDQRREPLSHTSPSAGVSQPAEPSGAGGGAPSFGQGLGALMGLSAKRREEAAARKAAKKDEKAASKTDKAARKAEQKARIVYGQPFDRTLRAADEVFRTHNALQQDVTAFNTALTGNSEGQALQDGFRSVAQNRYGIVTQETIGRVRDLYHGTGGDDDLVALRQQGEAFFAEHPELGEQMKEIDRKSRRMATALEVVGDNMKSMQKNGVPLDGAREMHDALDDLEMDNPELSPPGSRLDQLKERMDAIMEQVRKAIRQAMKAIGNLFGRRAP